MAWGGTNVYIYNKTGTAYVLTNSGNNNIYFTNDTINALLLNYTNAGIKSVSLSLGGTAIPGEQTASVRGVEEGITYLYDVTEPETITGFFLDGTEYKIGGDEAAWGNISGTLSDQTDLNTALNAKANDSDVVKTSGNQTVAGTKTFSTSPVVPSKTSDATNTGTAVATEAQVYKKQDKLTTQTAYSSKGSATKVPQITTNTLGQVTGITEVTITQPDISGKADKTEVLTKTNTTAFTPTGDYQPATKKYVDDRAVPTTGTTDYVLTKTANGYGWAAPAATGITNDTTGTTTTVEKIWAGNATEYANVTKVEGVIYHVYE